MSPNVKNAVFLYSDLFRCAQNTFIFEVTIRFLNNDIHLGFYLTVSNFSQIKVRTKKLLACM